MLTPDQKKTLDENIKKFKDKALEYKNMKTHLQSYEQGIKITTQEYEKVAAEERQMEDALDVLYMQSKKESKVREIQEKLTSLLQKSDILRNDLTQMKTVLIGQMRELPIPVDLENCTSSNSSVIFQYFQGTEFGNIALDTMSDLFIREQPLTFGDVELLPEKIVVNNVSKKQEAIRLLVNAIREFRMLVDSISKSYEQIDEMVERIKKSKRYSDVLKVLFRHGSLSSIEIARFLNVVERIVYDACYNMTRDNWNPHPVQKTDSGDWKLTLPGEILVNRLLEKYPNEQSDEEGTSQ